ncbi:Flp pilus assembly protein TadG [Neorhizobium sp. 2083]|uniref:TadE/TadG family type IV pilus assembly protein n=1 Tax=Neorhizobium sp. 2083 TaxID=2817762 RepID=UPI0013AF077E|nr:TadE/TadG family type IV pilus assembly protein [Neorhizobium sp. 2083]MDR6817081.1 Flp pilus assembly protein TadG [Neorhizobium sp. 2083]
MRHTLFARLAKDRAGNFGIMTAVALPVLLAVGGVAVDLTHVMEEKNKLQALADSATLAAAAAMADKGTMTADEAQTLAKTFLLGPKKADIRNSGLSPAEQDAAIAKLEKDTAAVATISTTSNTAASYEVTMTSAYDVPLTGLTSLLGFTTMRVAVDSKSASGREGNALSMYLALDESGSMAWDTTTVDPTNPTKQESYDCSTRWQYKTCTRDVPNYLSKMLSLKTAAAVMFAELKKADPNSELIRVGADSYDDKTKAEQKIAWGTSAVSTYVNKLPAVPDGGTDASGAMTNAFAALKAANATEKTAHDSKKNTSFERFIVLMTDGEMTGNSSSWNKTLDTKVRGICDDAKKDGIKIYTIAFMAPDNGKSLLEYCSSGKKDYYYEPDDMTTLVESFGEIARKAAKTGTRLTN